jgi:hypothetical protein
MIEFKIKNKIRNITIYILLKKKLKLKKKVVEFFFLCVITLFRQVNLWKDEAVKPSVMIIFKTSKLFIYKLFFYSRLMFNLNIIIFIKRNDG